MNLLQTILMAVKSILNNKVRAILTMIGIIVGVASIITLVAVMQAFQDQLIADFERFGTNRVDVGYYGQDPSISQEFYDYTINDLSDLVLGITPNFQRSFPLRYRSKELNTDVYFGSEFYDVANNYALESGRSVTSADIKNRTRVCVIGATVKNNFFGAMNPIGQEIKIKGLSYTIIGVYEARSSDPNMIYSNDNMIMVPESLSRELAGVKQFDSYLVKAIDADSTLEYVEKINEYMVPLLKNEWEFYAYSNTQYMEEAQQSLGMATLVGAGVVGISLIVGGIGIMNIMLVSVTERTREIGIRMAIGARRRDIVLQFLIEAATVSALGGMVGILIGAAGSAILGAYAFKILVLPQPMLVLSAILFSTSVGVIFGLYPAMKASKLQPVEALRTQ